MSRPTWDIVEHDRKAGHGPGDRFIVLINALLGGPVIVGRDHQRPVGSDLLSLTGQLDGLGGRVGTRAGNDRDAFVDDLDRQLDHLGVFFVRQGGRFTGCAARHDAVRAALDLPFDHGGQRLFVNPAVLEGVPVQQMSPQT